MVARPYGLVLRKNISRYSNGVSTVSCPKISHLIHCGVCMWGMHVCYGCTGLGWWGCFSHAPACLLHAGCLQTPGHRSPLSLPDTHRRATIRARCLCYRPRRSVPTETCIRNSDELNYLGPATLTSKSKTLDL